MRWGSSLYTGMTSAMRLWMASPIGIMGLHDPVIAAVEANDETGNGCPEGTGNPGEESKEQPQAYRLEHRQAVGAQDVEHQQARQQSRAERHRKKQQPAAARNILHVAIW